MIKDYDNDQKMMALGRLKARLDAIRRVKSAIRDNAVRLLNLDDVDEVNKVGGKVKEQLDELLELMRMV